MSNRGYICFFTILMFQVFRGQEFTINNDTLAFTTYNINELSKHELLFTKDKMGLRTISETGLGGSSLTWYKTTIHSDTIHFHKKPIKDTLLFDDIMIDDISFKSSFFEEFVEGSFLVISDIELLHQHSNRPYFKKSYIDSLFGEDNFAFAFNGEILKVGTKEDPQTHFNSKLEKPKKAKVKILDGKLGYKKYGVMGIKGVVEFYDKKRRKKKKM